MTNSTAAKRRWADRTPDERASIMRKTNETRSRNSRERKIREMIEAAPPLTAEQRARLAVLLSANDGQAVAS